MSDLGRVLRSWWINLVNSVVYLVSLGTRTLHEGRYSGGTWVNWNRAFSARPRRFLEPETEEELCRIVRESGKVRVVGAGHNFNEAPLSDDTMVSLDRMNRVLAFDGERNVVRVQAGIRLRDLGEQMEKLRIALPVAGSTNAQSLGGLVATDVHGSGRDHGFLSEQLLSLRIVDGRGEARTVRRGDELFHAAIGGSGLCGVVTELEIQCVPLYQLAKSIRIVDIAETERDIERILAEHDHVSFYYLGGVHTRFCRMNLWDETRDPVSPLLRPKKVWQELVDMGFSGFLLGLARSVHELDLVAAAGFRVIKWTMDGHVLVHPATSGFARRLFYHHDELEFGVPFERWTDCLHEVQGYLLDHDIYCLLEIRFTPDRSAALLGPGVGRRTCYIELAPSLTIDPTQLFADVERIFWKYGGQLHLGKATRAGRAELERMYSERLRRFDAVRAAQDPEGKFGNAFTARLFDGPRGSEASDEAAAGGG